MVSVRFTFDGGDPKTVAARDEAHGEQMAFAFVGTSTPRGMILTASVLDDAGNETAYFEA
jgi:hypothetical protein